jgi:hypothetical protein
VKPFVKLALRAPGLVTVTVTAPEVPAGVVAAICVALATTMLVAAEVPNVTVAPVAKFVPMIVTDVPPVVAPVFGEIALTVGGATYVNPLLRLPLCPLSVTVTATEPALPAGVVAVIWFALTTITLVAAVVPKATAAAAAKFVPVIVTVVPPATGPLFGETLVTVGTTT